MRHAALQGLLLGQNLVTLIIFVLGRHSYTVLRIVLRGCIMHHSTVVVHHTTIAL